MEELERFIKAQQNQFGKAIEEIREGCKKTHWMWYVFPQFKGLGSSTIAKYYEIQSIKEAEAYMENKVLGCRLLICCHELMMVPTDDAEEIFGPIDSEKLKSCMTLFYKTSGIPVFKNVLDKFFDGGMCEYTVEAIRKEREYQD